MRRRTFKKRLSWFGVLEMYRPVAGRTVESLPHRAERVDRDLVPPPMSGCPGFRHSQECHVPVGQPPSGQPAS